jgi:hypothetical protein
MPAVAALAALVDDWVAQGGNRYVVPSWRMSRREQLLDRIRPKLVCTSCRIGLDDRDGDGGQGGASLVCRRCSMTVRRDGGAFHFRGLRAEAQNDDPQVSVLDWLFMKGPDAPDPIWGRHAVAAPGSRP